VKKFNLKNFLLRFLLFVFVWGFILLCLYTPKIYNYFFRTTNSINVLMFTDLISQKTIEEFEKKTGMSVFVTYFESNDELLAKLKIDGGRGYDLLLTTDYMIEILRKLNLLKQIDHSKISNVADIDGFFLNRYFDPNNDYSIPYSWSEYGLAYSKDFFGDDIKDLSWSLIFNANDLSKAQGLKKYKVVMPSDPRDILHLASLYLLNRVKGLNDADLEKIKTLLIKQKRFVESYSSEKVDYFLYAKIVPIVACESSFLKKMQLNDPKAKKDFGFVVPKEGTLLSIENFAILNSTKNVEAVYKFIDFALSSSEMFETQKRYGINSVNKNDYDLVHQSVDSAYKFPVLEQKTEKLDTLQNDIDLEKLDELWLSVRVF